MATNPMHQFQVYPIGPEINLGPVNLSFTNSSLFMLISSATIILLLFFGTKKKLIVPSTNILILENLGLIVAGDDIEDTYKLLLKIHKKLDLIRNEKLASDYLEEVTNIDGYNHKNTDKYKLFSTQNEKLFSLFPKSFYPDHVIFLGPGIPTFLDEKEANEFIQNLKRKNMNLPPYLILKYKGLFENTLAIPAAKEMIDCFLEVLLRIDLSKSLKFLSSLQESELLNWDIEIYRQSIN